MNQSTYPIWLKTILKTTPAFVVYFAFGLCFTTTIHDIIYHPRDRIERYHFRSNKFERLGRKRDDKLRYYYKYHIEWQPYHGSSSGTGIRPLERY